MATHGLLDVWKELERRQTPNFFRLYLNPFVAQTCYCLNELVRETFDSPFEHQSFLANSFEEALSGAIKLARFASNAARGPSRGLVLDPAGRLDGFAAITLASGDAIEFVPELDVVGPGATIPSERQYGFVANVGSEASPELDNLLEAQKPLLIACVARGDRPPGLSAQTRTDLEACPHKARPSLHGACAFGTRSPDVVVFDGSFVRSEVPFAAFAAQRELYDLWNRRGYATFHSTTFQPNAVTSLHFLRCLAEDEPDFHGRHAAALTQIGEDASVCKKVFRRLYSPSLCKTITTLGMDTLAAEATGHYVTVGQQRFFDGISGIACSLRGHNPPGYAEEMQALAGLDDYHEAARGRLETLTGLAHLVPAVSGASAVETALRLGLVAQFPRKYVLALQGGFGGKTLFALTGTASSHYKTRLDPLYGNVVYVDPFAPNAIAELDRVLETFPVAIVQLELIQGVGGVRAIPADVVRFLADERQRRGYLLFVDEVQTGMFRTGPFVRSRALEVEPDLLTIGKAASDMMFPFSATLYSAAVHARLVQVKPDLAQTLRRRNDLEFGYKTLVNALDRAQQLGLSERVSRLGELFVNRLTAGLFGCEAVRDVRGAGLLIAIELDVERWPRRWLKKQAHSVYLLNVLRDASFPVLVGFCQYEPHVLKLTPPLTTTEEEAERICETLVRTLRRPFYRLLPALGGALASAYFARRERGQAPLCKSTSRLASLPQAGKLAGGRSGNGA